MAWPATAMVIARSERGARLKAMGSLTAMLPGGMVMPGWPLKVRATEELDWMAPGVPGAGRAAVAASRMRGVAPYSLVRTTRRVEPPRETWTIWRRVAGMRKDLWSLARGKGAVPQVATQWGWAVWAGVWARAGSVTRAARRNVRRRMKVRISQQVVRLRWELL
jgi:hypothetical protein